MCRIKLHLALYDVWKKETCGVIKWEMPSRDQMDYIQHLTGIKHDCFVSSCWMVCNGSLTYTICFCEEAIPLVIKHLERKGATNLTVNNACLDAIRWCQRLQEISTLEIKAGEGTLTMATGNASEYPDTPDEVRGSSFDVDPATVRAMPEPARPKIGKKKKAARKGDGKRR